MTLRTERMSKKSSKSARKNSTPKSLRTFRNAYRVGRAKTGLGLFATKPIPKGKLFIEYAGRRRLNDDIKRENRYMFEVNSKWTVDAVNRCHPARYANHSCRPNAESDIIRGRVYLRARKLIKPGDEITYDYGKDYFDAFIKPHGCRCEKCVEKRREERAARRRRAERRRKRAAAERSRSRSR
jgi:uncharacterized protein